MITWEHGSEDRTSSVINSHLYGNVRDTDSYMKDTLYGKSRKYRIVGKRFGDKILFVWVGGGGNQNGRCHHVMDALLNG